MANNAMKATEPMNLPGEMPAPCDAERAAMLADHQKRAKRPRPVRLRVDNLDGARCTIGPEHNDVHGWLIRMGEVFGTASDDFVVSQLNLMMRAAQLAATPEAQATVMNAMLAAIAGVQPRNEMEGMLAVQMAATHYLAMDMLAAMKHAQFLPQFEARGNMAVKLLRTSTAQIEALAKLRRKGEQTVRVEHVDIQPGAQAIVGNVNHSGGGGGSG